LKNRLPIIFILLIATIVTVLLSEIDIGENFEQKNKDDRSYQIDYYLKDMQALTLNALGNPDQKLQSKSVTHYKSDDTTAFDMPTINVFEESSSPWEITAKKGLMSSNGDLVLLKQNVKINKAGSEKKPSLKVVTANLKIRPNDGYAETDEAVRIDNGKNWLISVGMQAWFKKPSRIKLLANVKGYYDVR